MSTILLASSSPRRKEILSMLGIPFIAIHPEIDESVVDYQPPEERVVSLAFLKAAEAGRIASSPGGIPDAKNGDGPRHILAADTLVALRSHGGWKTLGKPKNEAEARQMLRTIQGRIQHVFTGLCVFDRLTGSSHTALSKSRVRFDTMDEDAVNAYLATGEWIGAAGAYRVQGWGAAYIAWIEGSPSGVMGLPIRELYGILSRAGTCISPPSGIRL
ncbi:MAG TPA: Maf family protein [Rectinemataceae bacterium]